MSSLSSGVITGIARVVVKNTFLIIMVGLTGCATKNIDPSFVAERWSSTLRAFNIDPVFPPRYMQPGDVYLALEPKEAPTEDKSRYKRRSIRLGRVDVREDLIKEAQQELRLPSTSDSKPTNPIFSIPEREDIVRLRPMGFTGFNIATVTEADIGAAVPIQALRALFGGARQDTLAMSISVPNAEFLELPAFIAYKALRSFCSPRGGTPSECSVANEALRWAWTSLILPGDKPEEMIPKIFLVTNVYYAREIDYTYRTKDGAALAISAALAAASSKESSPGTGAKPPTSSGSPSTTKPDAPAAVAGAGTPSSGTTTTTITTTTTSSSNSGSASPTAGAAAAKTATSSTPPGSATSQSEAEQQKAALLARIDTSQLGTAGPAGTLRVLTTNSEGTVLRQTFEFPVAIGYRALWATPGGLSNNQETK